MFLHLRMRGMRGRSNIMPSATMPISKEGKQERRYKSRVEPIRDDEKGGEDNLKKKSSENWVPHPRTGIYFPVGNEWVMADVPETAASFDRTCWFRNDDGVDFQDLEHRQPLHNPRF